MNPETQFHGFKPSHQTLCIENLDAVGRFLYFRISAFPLTFRVAEPEGLARHLRPSANGVTAQGLGGRSEATEAGNPVLTEGQSPVGLPGRQTHTSTYLRD